MVEAEGLEGLVAKAMRSLYSSDVHTLRARRHYIVLDSLLYQIQICTNSSTSRFPHRRKLRRLSFLQNCNNTHDTQFRTPNTEEELWDVEMAVARLVEDKETEVKETEAQEAILEAQLEAEDSAVNAQYA